MATSITSALIKVAVKRDIEEAARLKVHSTPTYVVNGTMMTGVLTPAAFQELVAVLRESQ